MFREMLDLLDIMLANFLAFSAVIRIKCGNGGSRREKDQPVAGGEFGTLVEPRRRDASVLQKGAALRWCSKAHLFFLW